MEPQGWGQPPQLFGLVPTSLLATSQPEWADILDDGRRMRAAAARLIVRRGRWVLDRLEIA